MAVLAGQGPLPRLFASAAAARGHEVAIFACRAQGAAEPAGEVPWRLVDSWPQAAGALAAEGYGRAALIGHFSRYDLSREPALALGADPLEALAGLLAESGTALLRPDEILPSLVPAPAALTRRRPSGPQKEDAGVGRRVLAEMRKVLGGCGAVVRRRVVLALQAVEPLEETIERGGRLAGGEAVVVLGSPGGQAHLGWPALGPQTVAALAAAGCGALALPAGACFFYGQEESLRQAERAGICIWAGQEGD